MHVYDCKVIAQIKHAGSKAAYAASIGVPFLVPSIKEMSKQEIDDGKEMVGKLTQDELAAFVSNLEGSNFKEMTNEDIDEVISQFKEAAKSLQSRPRRIEIHAGHGYIISAFLSSTNKRQDQYGGSKENRVRFLVEILQAVRSGGPKSFSNYSEVRWRRNKYSKWYNILMKAFFAKTIEHIMDAIHVSSYANAASGPDFTKAPLVEQKMKDFWMLQKIKRQIKVPIIGVGRIETKDARTLH